MSPRATIVAGLATGAVAAVILIVAAIAFLPDPALDAGTSPSPAGSAGAGTSSSPTTSGSAGPSSQPSATGSVGTGLFHVGEPAPALVLPQLGGGEINLAKLAGRPVWVNFMQTTCPPCVDEFPVMNAFAARYGESTGLVVVAVDIREEEGTVAAFVQGLNASFPVGLDADGTAQDAWDAIALPVHFWVDRDGIVRAGALGGIGPDIMAENLKTILPGVNVTP
ncbi:MAG: TlpA disulfide reductase family protein [Candidatus Limnocylindrales bacterium]